MRVLSFDVGIKNLAVCLLEWTETDTLIIHYWDVINLLESKKESEKCLCLKDKCSNKVVAYSEFNCKHYFCSKHLSLKEELLTPFLSDYVEDKWIQEKKLVCQNCNQDENINITTNSRKTYYKNDIINQTLCSKHYKSLIDKLNNSKTKIYTIKNKKVKDMTTDDLKFHLVKCLDERKNILLSDIDMVLIENQPTFKNPTMKAISDTLYTWFLIRGMVDSSTVKKIKFISPSNKLKEFNTKTIEEADETKKYKETKKLSIQNTKTVLLCYELNKWTDLLNSHTKKDDLADSFLQGWYVLNNQHNNKLYEEWEKLYNQKVINLEQSPEKTQVQVQEPDKSQVEVPVQEQTKKKRATKNKKSYTDV
jgi:hypothetical protein